MKKNQKKHTHTPYISFSLGNKAKQNIVKDEQVY